MEASSGLAEFARANSVSLTRFAYVLCGDHALAEDLVQDAYVALYRRYGERLTLSSPVAYARRIIVNTYISRGRKRETSVALLDELPDRPAPQRDDDARDEMWRLLATLSARQRAVLVLRYYVDLTDADIADVLSCRVGTVRSLAARACAVLRTHPEIVGLGERL